MITKQVNNHSEMTLATPCEQVQPPGRGRLAKSDIVSTTYHISWATNSWLFRAIMSLPGTWWYSSDALEVMVWVHSPKSKAVCPRLGGMWYRLGALVWLKGFAPSLASKIPHIPPSGPPILLKRTHRGPWGGGHPSNPITRNRRQYRPSDAPVYLPTIILGANYINCYDAHTPRGFINARSVGDQSRGKRWN